MMSRLILALVVTLTAIAWCAPADAQKQPTVSDIATCNKEAAAAAGSPSALPRPPAPDTPAISPKPGARASTDSTGQLLTNPADPRLEGMAAARADDAAFRAAYRACMQRLGY
jgi:hypothetical protein